MASTPGKKSAAGAAKGEVLGPTYQKGEPHGEELGRWRQKFDSRDERLKYLKSAERYWYSQDWFGSEKRKTPA